MPPLSSAFDFLRKTTWLAGVLCLLPVLVYVVFFSAIALNVNYVAFDDILILGIIPGFEDATWTERWQRITDPFPEHRLVFSRSLVLLSHYLFGRVNLVSLMVIGNLCWLGCAGVFYAVFRRITDRTGARLSLWYFVPVLWLWFNVQSYENIFWGVSSLCNFGLLFFAMLAFYYATHAPGKLWLSLLFALCATYTYGNGIAVFVVILFLLWVTGRRKEFFISLAVTVAVGFLYFSGFPQKTPSLDFSNVRQVKEGVAGFFGFMGAIAALDATTQSPLPLAATVVAGVAIVGAFLWIFRDKVLPLLRSLVGKRLGLSPAGQFALVLFVFVAVTTFAVVYKRIPLGGFDALFKGRYRMYPALALVALHLGALAWLDAAARRRWAIVALPLAVFLNLALLYVNYAPAVNNRRTALVQEFNARYNTDWLGLHMFDMSHAHYEKVRSYYQSDDPLAEGWNPRVPAREVPCTQKYPLDSVYEQNDELHVDVSGGFMDAEQDYTDGAYVLLKSDRNTYAAQPIQAALPLKTFLRRQRYFTPGFNASFHRASIEPGRYKLYVLLRKDGENTLFCTGRTWEEER